jgi:cell division protein FtsB
MTNNRRFFCVLSLMSWVVVFAGCGGGDNGAEAIRRMAEQSVREQSAQNRRIADATKSLVEADSKARSSMIEAHDQLQYQIQAERGALDQRRNGLESLREEIELDRRRAPIIAESIQMVGGLLACLCPLLLAAYVLYSMNQTIESDQEQIVNQILIRELTTDSPVLLPGPILNSQIDDHQHLLAVGESSTEEEPPF